ncbi:unnamed protein product [Rhizoctonia solani]|uniref:Uncharacterized protein n=1 Tax=Rhizoctonia solani TaxID=456999 RepID=A0A8H3H0E1_9AGAM|nr:unnamed protein product [Rhizoctonia solani]
MFYEVFTLAAFLYLMIQHVSLIKGIVVLTLMQEFMFKILNTSNVIKPSENLPATEVADSLNAFILSIEMAVASVAMLWAFSASEYSSPERPRATVAPAIVDSVNFGDFIFEMKQSLAFFWHRRQIGSHRANEDPLVRLNYHKSSVSRVTGNL